MGYIGIDGLTIATTNFFLIRHDRQKGDNMKAIIEVSKKSALLAGLDNEGDYFVNFSPADLTEAQRIELSQSNENNGAYLVNKRVTNISHLLTPVATADLDVMRMLLDERIKIRAEGEEKKRKYDQSYIDSNIHKIADDNDLVCVSMHRNKIELTFYAGNAFEKAKEINDTKAIKRMERIETELIPKLQAELDAKIAEEKENKEAAKKMMEQEEKEKSERLNLQLSQWVAEKGTDNQKARFAEGFLPQKEIIDAIRNEAFAPLDGFPRYERITVEEVQETCSEDYYGDRHEVTFINSEKDKLTAQEFDRLQEMRRLMPEATIYVREHEGVCRDDDCDGRLFRNSYHVTMKIGELNLTREYGDEVEFYASQQ